ncbi:MAG: hypothetical protein JSS29_13825 [Proteobacteria bacterium]|nr:hypothetical protein [Pseudomonadota bacterium]
MKMPEPHLPRFRPRIGARGIFRVGVVVLALILLGNLAVITFAWSQHPKTDGGLVVVLWGLSLGGLVLLWRLWRAAPQGGSAPPPATPGKPH